MANLTFPSNPVNGQKFTSNGKVFEYNSTTQRWSVTRAQLLGSLPDDVTIETPDLTLDNTAISFTASGTTVYVHYTVSDDVSVSIANNGLADASYATATLSKSNNTITITSGTADFSSANVVVTVTNNRTSNTASISLSALYLSQFGDYSNIDWRYTTVDSSITGTLAGHGSGQASTLGGFEVDNTNSRVFVFDGGDIRTYDISDIDNITQIGSAFTASATKPINSGVYDPTYDRLYCSVGDRNGCRMYSYDVSDPATGITQLSQSNVNIYNSIIVGIDEDATNATYTYYASYVPELNVIYGHRVTNSDGTVVLSANRNSSSDIDGVSDLIKWTGNPGKYFLQSNDDYQLHLFTFSPDSNSHTKGSSGDLSGENSLVAYDSGNDLLWMTRATGGLLYRMDPNSYGNFTFLGYGGTSNYPNGSNSSEIILYKDNYLYIKYRSGWTIEDVSSPLSIASPMDVVYSAYNDYGVNSGITDAGQNENIPKRNWAQWFGDKLLYIDYYSDQNSVLRVAK